MVRRQQQCLKIGYFGAAVSAETPEKTAWPVPNLQPTYQPTGNDSLADTEPFVPKHLHAGDYCRLSLPHLGVGIWLHQETFLPNWIGQMAHQR